LIFQAKYLFKKMNKLIINFIFSFLLLISCSQDRNTKFLDEQEHTAVDTSDVITSKDTEYEIKAKLKLSAEFDKKEFGEITLYDDYFNDEITKFFIKDDDGERVLTAVVYQDRIRYMKMLIQHVGDTSIENKQKHLKKIKGGLEKAIERGLYKITDRTYLKVNENGDIWYNAFIVIESRKSGMQNYWNLMAPEADFGYLKHMVKAFQTIDGFDTKFVIQK
jgi:hypothetical protein